VDRSRIVLLLALVLLHRRLHFGAAASAHNQGLGLSSNINPPRFANTQSLKKASFDSQGSLVSGYSERHRFVLQATERQSAQRARATLLVRGGWLYLDDMCYICRQKSEIDSGRY